MLRQFFFILLFYQVASNPIYRRDKKESVDSPPSLEDALPMEQQPVLGESPLDTATTTITPVVQAIPAEEMKNVIESQMVEENFDLEMAAQPKQDTPGEVTENIRKPAPIIDSTVVEGPKLKVTEMITTTPVPTLALPIEKINVVERFCPMTECFQAVQSRVTGQRLAIEDLDNLEGKNNEIIEMEEDVDLDGHSEILQPEAERKPDLPCDAAKTEAIHGKLVVPGAEGGSARDRDKFPLVDGFDHLSEEETFFRFLAYILSLFASPIPDEPTTWQKIIAGIHCVLRDCRDALPLRPTSSFPLDDNSFIIRRARESLCPCVFFDGKDG